MAEPSYGSTASTSTRASASTVPPPSTSSTRRDVHIPYGPSSSPRSSTGRNPRRQRLHRASLMGLSDQPASSPRTLLPASASGSGSSLGSPYSPVLRRRQARRAEEVDNWASLKDMVSEDEEEKNDHSDTSASTLRPTRQRIEPSGPRSLPSVTSARSFFTARDSLRSERSGFSIRNGCPSDGLLSSSPPQMNGFGNMEEVMEDGGEETSKHGSTKTIGGDGMKGAGNETQPLLPESSRPTPPKSGQLPGPDVGSELMYSGMVEKLATKSCRYRNIQMLNSLSHRIFIHIRPSPLGDAIFPVRNRRPRSGQS